MCGLLLFIHIMFCFENSFRTTALRIVLIHFIDLWARTSFCHYSALWSFCQRHDYFI